ncbi:unnamed protein product, partial [Symbiodinium microadriaticum]
VNSFPCHDFPVTGMSLAPQALITDTDVLGGLSRNGAKAVLSTCSADNKMALIVVQSKSQLLSLQAVVIFLVILSLLLLGVAVLNRINMSAPSEAVA